MMVGGLGPWGGPAPQPAAVAAPDRIPPVPTLAPGQTPPMTLERARPTHIDIADLGVHAEVGEVGLETDGSIEVPDLSSPDLTGWFNLGPSPGEVGPAAIVGHVDSRRSGAAVFYPLGGTTTGTRIEVTRSDGTVAVFTVDLVESYDKETFPYDAVFADTGYPTLRLITCGGSFDDRRGSYTHNIVVYATLTTVVK